MRDEFRFGDHNVKVHLAVIVRRGREHEKISDIGALLLAEPLAVIVEESTTRSDAPADLGLDKIA